MTKVVGFRVLGQSLTTWAIGFSTQFCSLSNFAAILDTWSTQAEVLSFFGIEKYEIGPHRKQPALAFLFVSPLTRTSMIRVRVRVQQVAGNSTPCISLEATKLSGNYARSHITMPARGTLACILCYSLVQLAGRKYEVHLFFKK